MKVVLQNLLQKSILPVIGVCLIAGPITGCGDASDPEAVSIDELKAPGNLWIQDHGNGDVTLYWNGSNFEDDFDGYNVYGMKNGGDLLGTYSEGESVKFLNETGDPVEGSKEFIAKFNFDPANPYEAAAAAPEDDGEKKFAALPVHTSDEEPQFPTCGHDSTKTADEGNCVMHSADFVRAKVGDESSRGVAGQMGFKVSGLTAGSEYCFFVLASMDEGKKVSNSSTNISCVVPRYKVTGQFAVPASGGTNQFFDVITLLKSCMDGTCGAIATTDATGAADSASATGVYVEHYSKGGLTAGQYIGIQDLGFYADGFSDDTLPRKAPAYAIGNAFDADPDPKTPIKSTGGYAPYGQTVGMLQNHVYVVAVPEKAAADLTEVPTSFYYHWIFVSGTGDQGSNTDVEIRLGAKMDAR